MSALEASGNGPTLSADMTVDNYHGNFIYNLGDPDGKVRPFVFMGIGATTYGEVQGGKGTIPSNTRFSWAMGAGVKAFFSEHVGFKGTFRWTPTYIKTVGAGWWCDPLVRLLPGRDALLRQPVRILRRHRRQVLGGAGAAART